MDPEVAALYAKALPVKSAEQEEAEAAAQRLRENALPVSELLGEADHYTGRKHVFFLSLLLLAFVAFLGFLGGDWAAHWLLEVNPKASTSSSSSFSSTHKFNFVDEEVLTAEVDYALVLRKFYTKFNPNRLADVPNILDRYNGRETELFAKLKQKYGADPMSAEFGYNPNGIDTAGEEKSSAEEEEEEEDDDDEEGSLIEGEEEERLRSVKEHVSKGEDFIQHKIDEIKQKVGAQAVIDQRAEISALSRESPAKDSIEDSIGDSVDDAEEDEDSPEIVPSGGDIRVKVICVGLVHTGISEISSFLSSSLSMKTSTDGAGRLQNVIIGTDAAEFNVFDHDEAIIGQSTSAFFLELMATYPLAKVIISVRDVDSWYEAVKASGAVEDCPGGCNHDLQQKVNRYLFGTVMPNEYWWKRRYVEFYSSVLASVPRSKRKLVDLFSKDAASQYPAWKWIAYFLGKPDKSLSAPKLPLQISALREAQSKWPIGPDPMVKLPTKLEMETGSFGQLKIIAAGLDFTGETALVSALKKLGFKVLAGEDLRKASHKACGRHASTTCTTAEKLRALLSKETLSASDFGYNGVFQGVDALVGAPAALFWELLLRVNPDAKVVLTVRDGAGWFAAMKAGVSLIVL